MANRSRSGFESDPRLEAYFTQRAWRFDRLPAFAYDTTTTIEEAQVRAINDRADPEVVNRYANAMAAGATFPPGVVAEIRLNGEVLTTPVDIHHRMGAARKNGISTLPVYMLHDVPLVQLKLFALGRNRGHGKELSDEEALAAVGELLDAGVSVETIQRDSGLTRGQIDRAAHTYRFGKRADALNIPHDADEERRLNQIKKSARATMSQKLERPAVFEATLKLALDAAMNGSEAAALTKQVSQAPSEAEALQVIATERSLRAAQIERIRAGFVAPRTTALQSFRMHSGALLGLTPTDCVDTNATTRQGSMDLARSLVEFAKSVLDLYV